LPKYTFCIPRPGGLMENPALAGTQTGSVLEKLPMPPRDILVHLDSGPSCQNLTFGP
jgi:hypothetical protein